MHSITLIKKDKKLIGNIELPTSKSISNRALVVQYLCDQQTLVENLSISGDTILMHRLLETIKINKGSEIPVNFDCENAGTVIRFLTALLSITPGTWILTGSNRMKERPIGKLVDALNSLSAEINYQNKKGYPPVVIKGKPLKGGNIRIDGSISSQYISALLMIAPILEDGLRLTLINKINSKPYIEMTLAVMKEFGIESTFAGNEITIRNQSYQSNKLIIEADWSSAAYWYEFAAVADEADILLKRLKPDSIQGDNVLIEIYKSFGIKTEFQKDGIRLIKSGQITDFFEYDFTNCPDLAQSVIVTCAALGIEGVFTGLESLRIKETDRLEALQTELQKLGFSVNIVRNSEFEVRSYLQNSIKNQKSKILKIYGDHRMAMALAPLVLLFNNIIIENPQVVSKSYPGFWEDLAKMNFVIVSNS